MFVNDTCVLGYTHQDVVNMFQKIPIGERVQLEICRGYSLPFDPNDPNTEIVTTVAVTLPERGSQSTNTPSLSSSNKSLPNLGSTNNNVDKNMDALNAANLADNASKPEILTVNIVKGSMGFGFTIADSAYGQKVKQIMDRRRCQTLLEGDILVEINNIKVKDMNHADVVRVLKNCRKDVPSTIIIQRGGILTPNKNKKNGKAVCRYAFFICWKAHCFVPGGLKNISFLKMSLCPLPKIAVLLEIFQVLFLWYTQVLEAILPKISEFESPPIPLLNIFKLMTFYVETF